MALSTSSGRAGFKKRTPAAKDSTSQSAGDDLLCCLAITGIITYSIKTTILSFGEGDARTKIIFYLISPKSFAGEPIVILEGRL
jgi:hypothetical protein